VVRSSTILMPAMIGGPRSRHILPVSHVKRELGYGSYHTLTSDAARQKEKARCLQGHTCYRPRKAVCLFSAMDCLRNKQLTESDE